MYTRDSQYEKRIDITRLKVFRIIPEFKVLTHEADFPQKVGLKMLI